MQKHKNQIEKREELKFINVFLSLVEEETLTKEMSIAKDKNEQYNVRIPKEFADTVNIDADIDSFVFQLRMPSIAARERPQLTASLKKGDEKEIISQKKDMREDTDKLAKSALKKIKGMDFVPFNLYELCILRVLAQRKKGMNAQEIASATNLTWPTADKYLNILKKKGFVKIVESGVNKRTKWIYNHILE